MLNEIGNYTTNQLPSQFDLSRAYKQPSGRDLSNVITNIRGTPLA